jgi:transposase
MRTSLINHVRGICKVFGIRLSDCSTRSFHKRAAEQIPAELLCPLRGVLNTVEGLTATITTMDQQVEEVCDTKYAAETKAVRQVHGVGALTALTLGRAERFKSSRAVGAYLGLKPKRADSGQDCPQLHITKAGNGLLRRFMVTSAQYILGPLGRDCDLRRWGLKKAEGGKRAKKRAVVAVVAVARKLAVLLHRLWITGEVYEPLRTALRNGQHEHAPAA